MDKISVDELRRILAYDPEAGTFTWLIAPAYWKKAGTPAGSESKRTGYVMIGWQKKLYQAAHVAWALMTGEWPAAEIDHINRQPGDNRWRNLREATSAQNKTNRRVRKDSVTGIKGVMPHKGGRWRAKIRHNGKHYHLGLFDTAEAAAEAYRSAAKRFHGEFAHDGT